MTLRGLFQIYVRFGERGVDGKWLSVGRILFNNPDGSRGVDFNQKARPQELHSDKPTAIHEKAMEIAKKLAEENYGPEI